MKSDLLLTTLAVGLAVLASSFMSTHPISANKSSLVDKKTEALYQEWRLKFKGLATVPETPAETQFRMTVFTNNYKFVQQRNLQYTQAIMKRFGQAGAELISKPTFVLTESADLTEKEYLALHAGLRSGDASESSPDENMSPESGLTSGLQQQSPRPGFQMNPRSQGACASCWAFTAVAIAEKFFYQQTGKQVSLSVQELVDCDKASNGCLGGWPQLGLKYINSKDVTTEALSPYQCDEGICSSSSKKVRTGLKGLLDPTTVPFSLEVVQKATSQGYFVGTGINAGGDLRFINSSDDVFYPLEDDCKSGINHAVTLIEGTSEWVRILNSAGPNWGYKGTKRIAPCTESTLLGNTGSLYLPAPL